MDDFKVLILDDDEKWLALHERRLNQAGIKYISTQHSQDAIKVAHTDPLVKLALIDEILYVPYPYEEGKCELQRWQGSGVIREINSYRSDLQFIIVTAAVQIGVEQQSGDIHLFRRETAKLRRQPGVVDVVHKLSIEENPEETYQWVIDIISSPKYQISSQVTIPKVLVGLGFPPEILDKIAEQAETKRRKFIPLNLLLKKTGHSPDKFLDQLYQEVHEQRLFLEMPGSKNLDPVKGIKPNTSAFKILFFLARQSELHRRVAIGDEDYDYKPRRSGDVVVVDEAVDQEYKDFAYEYSASGRQISSGVQVEVVKLSSSAQLKVAISRLNKHLQKLNVCPSRCAFIGEEGYYIPNFELGIVMYSTNCNNKNQKFS